MTVALDAPDPDDARVIAAVDRILAAGAACCQEAPEQQGAPRTFLTGA